MLAAAAAVTDVVDCTAFTVIVSFFTMVRARNMHVEFIHVSASGAIGTLLPLQLYKLILAIKGHSVTSYVKKYACFSIDFVHVHTCMHM